MLKQPTEDEARSLRSFRKKFDIPKMINKEGVSYFLNNLTKYTRISTMRLSELLNKKKNPGFVSNIVGLRRHLPMTAAVTLTIMCDFSLREKVALYEKIAEGLRNGIPS